LTEPGPVLAVDYGDRRTGLAVSDPRGVIAQPLPTVEEENPEKLARAIAALVREREVRTVVVGLPLRLDGAEGARVEKTRRFERLLARALEGSGVQVAEWDERLTTAEATERLREAGFRARARRKRVDAVAAVLILRSYLASQPGGPPPSPASG
jgi:putative Holliday junction resolvase